MENLRPRMLYVFQRSTLNITVLNVSIVLASELLLPEENFLAEFESIFSISKIQIHLVLNFDRTTSL